MAIALTCPVLTRAWKEVPGTPLKYHWPGDPPHWETTDPLTRCNYSGSPHQLLCHFVATHRRPVRLSRLFVTGLAILSVWERATANRHRRSGGA